MSRFFTRIATFIASAAGRPGTFIVALTIVAVWALSGPLFAYSDTWQLVINTGTTIVTFLMVFLIQNSQNRDSAALQCKLDELIRSIEQAREQFIGIEHLPDDEICKIRDELEAEAGATDDPKARPHDSVSRLLDRR